MRGRSRVEEEQRGWGGRSSGPQEAGRRSGQAPAQLIDLCLLDVPHRRRLESVVLWCQGARGAGRAG